MKINRRKIHSFISLFCGCGGFDLGFIQAGFNCIGSFDLDPIAVKNHKENISSNTIVRDLSNNYEDFKEFVGVDVVLAGPPCQGFSTIGKRQFDDPRNQLLLAAGYIAVNICPKVFLVENVKGVVAGEHKQYWIKLHNILRLNGYRTTDMLINAEQFGIAQIRKRMVLMAWKTSGEWKPIQPSKKIFTLRKVLSNVEGVPNHTLQSINPNSEIYMIAKHIKPGQKLCNVRDGNNSVHTWDIPEVFGEITEDERKVLQTLLLIRRRLRLRTTGDADPVLASDISKELGLSSMDFLNSLIDKGYVRRINERFDLTNTFNGKYRRLKWDEPSLTVDTRFINPRYFLHPEEDRGFTVREAARIQGFPDSYIFGGSEKDQSRLIGNAVPPPLGKLLAESIKPLIG